MKQAQMPKRPLTMTQLIVKTSAITFCIAFVTFSYGIAAFGLIFPRAMAKFCDTLGAENAAGMYYERVYNRDKTPENLYMVVDRYIMAQNYKKVVTYGSKFLDLEESNKEVCQYCKIIKKVNSHYEKKAGNNKYKLLQWANEDSRIKSAYTAALINTGKQTRARVMLGDWLINTPNTRQPNHAFIVAYIRDSSVIDGHSTTKQLLEEYVDKFEVTLGEEVDNIFAFDFLAEAHFSLNSIEDALEYVRLLNALL